MPMEMMASCGAGMAAFGVIGILLLLFLILAIAALGKYLLGGRSSGPAR